MQATLQPTLNTTTDRAVERLTQHHTVHYDGHEYECEPLLEQLRHAISSSIGAGSGGSRQGGLLNMAAFTLWETIDGIARGWQESLAGNSKGELAHIIQQLPRAIQAAHVNEQINDDMRERLDAMFDKWVYEIEDLFDPPHEKTFKEPCPKCGETHNYVDVLDMDGKVVDKTRQAALTLPVKRGRALVAECRCCGAMWATERELIELADQMGIEVDFVALRELVNDTRNTDASGAEKIV